MNYKYLFLLLTIFVIKSKTASIEQEVANSTKFTLDWYRTTFDANTNTVVSPLSFRILLSLLYHGTFGDTEQELKQNVYFSGKEETAISQLLTLNKLRQNPNLKVVNKVYIKEGFEIKPTIQARALEYHSEFEQKDFTKSQQTANEINHFVEENTNGLIKNLVSPNIFKNTTRLFLLNTLYFKADWFSQFDETKVANNDFFGIDGHKYSIDFMNKKGYYKLHDNTELHASVLKLDYVTESDSQFIIILPDENTNINEVKNHLNYVTMSDIFNNNNEERRQIFMPKFEIESEINGVDSLRKLGLNALFNNYEIDALQNGVNLTVSDAKQKAKIIVNSKGTEAAAVSYVHMPVIRPMIALPPYTNFYVNRPFIYLIATVETKETLFIGHYSQPGSEFFVI